MTETDRVEEVKLHDMVSAARMGKDDPKPEEGNCTNKYLKNKRVHQDVAGERESPFTDAKSRERMATKLRLQEGYRLCVAS